MIMLRRIVGAMGASVFVFVFLQIHEFTKAGIVGDFGFFGFISLFGFFGPIVVVSVIPLVAWRGRYFDEFQPRLLISFLMVPFAVVLLSYSSGKSDYFDLFGFPLVYWVPFFVSLATFLPNWKVSVACGLVLVAYLMYFGLSVAFAVFDPVFDKPGATFNVWASFAWIYLQFLAFAFFPEPFRWLRKKSKQLFSKS